MSNEEGYLPPSMFNDVRTAIAENMAKNGTEEKPGALSSHAHLDVSSIYDKYKQHLSADAQFALEKSANSLVERDEETGTLNQVRYLGKRVPSDRVDEAAKYIIAMINDLASKKLIKSALLPLSTLKIGDEIAVISYLMLSYTGVQYFDENLSSVRFSEAEIPSKLEEE